MRMDCYEKDGSPVSIDYGTPEGKALSRASTCHGDEHRKYPKEMN